MARQSSTITRDDTTLPSPREFLTSLLNTLTSQDDSDDLAKSAVLSEAGMVHNAPKYGHDNVFKLLPIASRALITTLHVLFPGILLQALDLLDRHLVTKITYEYCDEQNNGEDGTGATKINHDDVHGTYLHGLKDNGVYGSRRPTGHKEDDTGTTRLKDFENFFYLVQSAQLPRRNNRHGPTSASNASTGLTYTVRLQAWNCSCAAFAFSTFPAIMPPFTPRYKDEREQHLGIANHHGWGKASNAEEWDFGNLSSDGAVDLAKDAKAQEGVPCCKHLLAALLVERWGGVLGKHANVRHVGRDEMAGLGSD